MLDMHNGSFAAASAFLLVLPFITGCYFTGGTWAEADATRMGSPKIIGSFQDGNSNDSPRSVVIRYELETHWRGAPYPFVFVLVSQDGKSKPSEPFCVEAAGRTPTQILAAISTDHLQSLSAPQFNLLAPGGRKPQSIKGFVPCNPSEPDGGYYFGNQRSDPALTVQAWRSLADGRIEMRWVNPDEHIPAGVMAVVMPSETLRPAADAQAAKARAAWMTPLALVADVFVSPVIYGAYILHGGG